MYMYIHIYIYRERESFYNMCRATFGGRERREGDPKPETVSINNK